MTVAAASIAAVFVLAQASPPAASPIAVKTPSATATQTADATPAATTTPTPTATPVATASPSATAAPSATATPAAAESATPAATLQSAAPEETEAPTPRPPVPPTAVPQTPSIYPTPAREPDLFPTVVRPFARPTAAPSGAPPTSVPQATATPPSPEPGFGRITADRVFGKANGDMEADGHVLIVLGDSTVTANSAHYDSATRMVRAAGNVRYVAANGDTATAKALEYDVANDRLIMDGVEGQTSSVTYQAERIHGYIFYKGERITIDHNGHALLERGWVTTCDLRHVAYHITGKEIEIRPNDRLIAHGPALYLGSLAVPAPSRRASGTTRSTVSS